MLLTQALRGLVVSFKNLVPSPVELLRRQAQAESHFQFVVGLSNHERPLLTFRLKWQTAPALGQWITWRPEAKAVDER